MLFAVVTRRTLLNSKLGRRLQITFPFLSENMALNAGASFHTFQEFDEVLKQFQIQNNVVFSRKSSKKLTSYHPAQECLKYEYVHLECKQGKKRSTRSKGIRPNQRTLKCDCKAYIRLAVVESGGNWILRVTGASHEHTYHPVDSVTASLYPENRRPTITETVRALALANVPQSKLKEYIQETQGKNLLPKDVMNLSNKLKTDGITDTQGVDKILEEIRNEEGYSKFGVSECGEFEYLFFVTRSMKRDLDRFCDVLVMDATYKMNCYLYPLVNVLCVDGEGGGRPVLHGFVRNESCTSLLSCLSFLKSVMSMDINGPSVFFVDKDFAEIAAIHETFPDALIRLCSFHASTAVKRALSSHGLSSQLVDALMTNFKEQRDTRSQERFQELCEIMRRDVPDKTVQYFQTNWWDKADMWATHTNLDTQTLHLTTTNHVESYHSKIKQTLHPQTRLTDSIKALLTYDFDLIRTKDMHSHIRSISHHYNVTHKNTELENIMNSLTAFGGKIVAEQYHLAKKFSYIHSPIASSSTETTQAFHVTGETQQKRSYTTTITKCICDFFFRFHLTCRHIFSLRHFTGQPLFSIELFSCSHFINKTRLTGTPSDGIPEAHDSHVIDVVPIK
ncbi:Zinc finger swim domain-containing protein 3 [Plakobranchus ocellatus]|uniref:Zinc finger swim domain-containing protein 3 n=1 Tax=Plakobranchus ocellatus TaxID=259542 RepID=A0AAV4A889_9GAST|nr:Zinc finger swim domain-containing protein 3 [Plakobranchus ocellatus]